MLKFHAYTTPDPYGVLFVCFHYVFDQHVTKHNPARDDHQISPRQRPEWCAMSVPPPRTAGVKQQQHAPPVRLSVCTLTS